MEGAKGQDLDQGSMSDTGITFPESSFPMYAARTITGKPWPRLRRMPGIPYSPSSRTTSTGAEDKLSVEGEAVFVDWNRGKDSYADMRLMTSCDELVIANSSFSWWGAWLGERAGRRVFAPLKWWFGGSMPDNTEISRPLVDKGSRRLKAFVINLRGNPERRAFMKAQMVKLGLDYEFFDAIEGARYRDDPRWYDPKKSVAAVNRELRPGEVGCALSHAFVYKEIARRELPCAFVLEDDAILNDDVPAVLEKFEKGELRQGEIVFLERCDYVRPFSSRPCTGTIASRLPSS